MGKGRRARAGCGFEQVHGEGGHGRLVCTLVVLQPGPDAHRDGRADSQERLRYKHSNDGMQAQSSVLVVVSQAHDAIQHTCPLMAGQGMQGPQV